MVQHNKYSDHISNVYYLKNVTFRFSESEPSIFEQSCTWKDYEFQAIIKVSFFYEAIGTL